MLAALSAPRGPEKPFWDDLRFQPRVADRTKHSRPTRRSKQVAEGSQRLKFRSSIEKNQQTFGATNEQQNQANERTDNKDV